jgi:hypothetical protein
MRQEAPVAGRDLVGATMAGDMSPGLRRVAIKAPANTTDTHVCLSLIAIDGLYVARNTYTLPASGRGALVDLPVPTKFPEVFSKATLETLASVVQLGPCSGAPGPVIPLVRNVELAGAAEDVLILAVNSARTDAFISIDGGAGPKRVACTPVAAARRTAFDALCRIVLPKDAAEVLTVRVERCEFGACRSSPATQIRLK